MLYFLYSKKTSIVPTYILFSIDYKSHNFAELCDFLRFTIDVTYYFYNLLEI